MTICDLIGKEEFGSSGNVRGNGALEAFCKEN